MDTSLLNLLINSYEKEYGKLMEGGRPLISERRQDFFPRGAPPQMGNIEGFLSSLFGSGGATNAFTGKVGLSADFGGWSLEDILNAMVHENYHSRRTNMSMASNERLRNRSIELMGGEETYNKFMQEIRPEELKKWPYYVQSLMPYFGKRRMDEETMAYWLGRSSVSHSKSSLKEALEGKANQYPNLQQLYDLHLQGIDLLQNR